MKFWFTASDGQPEPKFHFYSSWLAAAVFDRACVSGDWTFAVNLLDDLIADYAHWKQERQLTDGPFAGLYWQYDVRDGMEESITGSRKHKNARPTISSYMFANARAIAAIARRTAGKTSPNTSTPKPPRSKTSSRQSSGTRPPSSSKRCSTKSNCPTRGRRSTSCPGPSTCPTPATKRRGSN
ncbi:MAG: hypothetical protein QM754_05950 [Tepidisphaeraceae bacterium]